MLLKCYTQYASKFGKLSHGHRTGKNKILHTKMIHKKWWKCSLVLFLTHRPTWGWCRHGWWLYSQRRSGTLSQTNPDTRLSVFGFLRTEETSLSSVTQPQGKGPPEAKRGKEGPFPGASETAQPCWHIVSKHWPPELWENAFLLF